MFTSDKYLSIKKKTFAMQWFSDAHKIILIKKGSSFETGWFLIRFGSSTPVNCHWQFCNIWLRTIHFFFFYISLELKETIQSNLDFFKLKYIFFLLVFTEFFCIRPDFLLFLISLNLSMKYR